MMMYVFVMVDVFVLMYVLIAQFVHGMNDCVIEFDHVCFYVYYYELD